MRVSAVAMKRFRAWGRSVVAALQRSSETARSVAQRTVGRLAYWELTTSVVMSSA